MPDREVTCIRDIIYYQYAKIIAKSAFHLNDGREAKKEKYGFIKERFRALKNEKITVLDIDYILHNHPQEIYSNSNLNAII